MGTETGRATTTVDDGTPGAEDAPAGVLDVRGRADDVELVVVLGTGLLDEPVAATGTLALALAGLRCGLLGDGPPAGAPDARTSTRGTSAAAPVPAPTPEVVAELGTDTAALILRGSRPAVLGALRRLPDAFDPALVTDDLDPVAPERPSWPADLVQRAGRSAAALAALVVAAPDVTARARALLPELDPRRGPMRCVLDGGLADDPEAADVARAFGSVGPTRAGGAGVDPGAWADGTARLPDPVVERDRSAVATTASGSRPGTLPATDDAAADVLLSALVPRCVAGLAAADLLLVAARDALDRARAVDDEGSWGLPARVTAELRGVGPHLLVVLRGDRRPGPGVPAALAAELAAVEAAVSDDDLVAALVGVDAAKRGRVARDRLVLGLAPETAGNVAAGDAAAVRWSLGVATGSVHVPADPVPLDLPDDVELPEAGPGLAWTPGRAQPGSGPAADPAAGPAAGPVGTGPGPAAAVPALPPLVTDSPLGRRRLFRAWSRQGWGDAAATRTVHLVVGEGGVVAGRRTGVERRPVSWSPVDLGRLLAVVTDRAGTATLVDGSLRLVPVHPRLFRRGRALRAELARVTAGAPHLVVEGGTDAGLIGRRVRRDRAVTVAAVGVPAVAALAAVVALGASFVPEPEVVQSRVEIGQPVALHGGGRMTVRSVEHVVLDGPTGVRDVGGRAAGGAAAPLSDLVLRGSGQGAPERLVLEVEACAGDDDVAVGEETFWAAGASGSSGVPIATEDPLPGPVLAAGSCASGLVAFEGVALDEPRAGHETTDEDSVWYQPGAVRDPTS